MPEQSSRKLGKLSIAILENFVKSNLGDGFVKELREDYDRAATISQALEKTEKRFVSEFSDRDLSKAMFVDLSQQDRPALTNSVGQFFDHPTASNFKEVLCDTLLGEFKSLTPDRVEKGITAYITYLTEELAMLDSEFRNKMGFLIDFRREKQTQDFQSKKEKPDQKTFQIPPLPPQGVFGRDDDLKHISEIMALGETNGESIPPVALRGMGGIGKTTLAIAFAHAPQIKSSLQDGVLWTSLGPKPTVRLLLDAWGRALGVDLLPEHDESACQNRLRQVLYDRQMLIVVDDVWDIIQGSYFQVGGPRCRTLFTTREVPIATNLATRERTLRIEVLKPEFAIGLLYKLAPETTTVDKKIAVRLCERLEFLPLGITLAGRMLANEADVPQRMQRLVGELVDRRETRLQLMQTEGRPGLDEENPVSLQAILGMSVERLDKLEQERFAMLSVFGGEPLTWETNAASAVWECSVDATESTISHFIQRGLVERHGDRYWMHALLADYAAEMMVDMDL
jgi:hypothetical protein